MSPWAVNVSNKKQSKMSNYRDREPPLRMIIYKAQKEDRMKMSEDGPRENIYIRAESQESCQRHLNLPCRVSVTQQGVTNVTTDKRGLFSLL